LGSLRVGRVDDRKRKRGEQKMAYLPYEDLRVELFIDARVSL